MSYLGWFGEIDLANSILGHFQNPAGFREGTFISNTAYTAVAYFFSFDYLNKKSFKV